jgi:starch-binding outer membrane protein, SusD/RagB family
MKKIKTIGKLILVGFFMTTFAQSCTNLDEELFDVVTPEDFLVGEEQYVAYLGQAYTKLYPWATGGDLIHMNVASSDEALYPTRGSDWDDGGIHRRRQLHSWTYEDNGGAWNFGFGGISDCNRLIASYDVLVQGGSISREDADVFIGELAALRAFFYYVLIDLYGSVPIVTDFPATDDAPTNKSRQEVYSFINDELAEWAPKLTKTVGGTAYGRMNYYAAKALEAKVKINAGVWTGTADWDGVIAACDEIINSGAFSLESDFFTNFNVNNSSSREFIFAIPYDQVFATGFEMNMNTLHYGSQNTYNLTAQPWNGFCALEEFYNSFEDEDLRKGDPGTLDGPQQRRGTFLAGYQYKSDGTLVTDSGAEPTDPDGQPVNFDPKVTTIGPNAIRQVGARNGKWEFEMGGTQNMNNDYAIFRYADILLMKAEALWRKSSNPTDGTALALVNQVRTTHGGPDIDPLTTLDGPISFKIEEGVQPGGELLNERGREMAFEMTRRQDLIRWGVFSEVEKWSPPSGFAGDAINSDPTRNVFPIPRTVLEANRNLTQNPGYTSVGG